MTPDLPGVLLALAGFAVTFMLARSLSAWLKRRQSRKAQLQVEQNQSRQVRRAKARAGKRPR
jgi:hypothetical protein